MKEKILIWMLKGLTKDTIRRRLIFWKIKSEVRKMKSWKTTTAGIGAILSALSLIAKSIHDGDYSQFGVAITGVLSGIGLLMARDNDKSSEDIGVK